MVEISTQGAARGRQTESAFFRDKRGREQARNPDTGRFGVKESSTRSQAEVILFKHNQPIIIGSYQVVDINAKISSEGIAFEVSADSSPLQSKVIEALTATAAGKRISEFATTTADQGNQFFVELLKPVNRVLGSYVIVGVELEGLDFDVSAKAKIDRSYQASFGRSTILQAAAIKFTLRSALVDCALKYRAGTGYGYQTAARITDREGTIGRAVTTTVAIGQWEVTVTDKFLQPTVQQSISNTIKWVSTFIVKSNTAESSAIKSAHTAFETKPTNHTFAIQLKNISSVPIPICIDSPSFPPIDLSSFAPRQLGARLWFSYTSNTGFLGGIILKITNPHLRLLSALAVLFSYYQVKKRWPAIRQLKNQISEQQYQQVCQELQTGIIRTVMLTNRENIRQQFITELTQLERSSIEYAIHKALAYILNSNGTENKFIKEWHEGIYTETLKAFENDFMLGLESGRNAWIQLDDVGYLPEDYATLSSDSFAKIKFEALDQAINGKGQTVDGRSMGVLTINEDDPRAWLLRMQLNQRLGKEDEVKKDFSKARELAQMCVTHAKRTRENYEKEVNPLIVPIVDDALGSGQKKILFALRQAEYEALEYQRLIDAMGQSLLSAYEDIKQRNIIRRALAISDAQSFEDFIVSRIDLNPTTKVALLSKRQRYTKALEIHEAHEGEDTQLCMSEKPVRIILLLALEDIDRALATHRTIKLSKQDFSEAAMRIRLLFFAIERNNANQQNYLLEIQQICDLFDIQDACNTIEQAHEMQARLLFQCAQANEHPEAKKQFYLEALAVHRKIEINFNQEVRTGLLLTAAQFDESLYAIAIEALKSINALATRKQLLFSCGQIILDFYARKSFYLALLDEHKTITNITGNSLEIRTRAYLCLLCADSVSDLAEAEGFLQEGFELDCSTDRFVDPEMRIRFLFIRSSTPEGSQALAEYLNSITVRQEKSISWFSYVRPQLIRAFSNMHYCFSLDIKTSFLFLLLAGGGLNLVDCYMQRTRARNFKKIDSEYATIVAHQKEIMKLDETIATILMKKEKLIQELSCINTDAIIESQRHDWRREAETTVVPEKRWPQQSPVCATSRHAKRANDIVVGYRTENYVQAATTTPATGQGADTKEYQSEWPIISHRIECSANVMVSATEFPQDKKTFKITFGYNRGTSSQATIILLVAAKDFYSQKIQELQKKRAEYDQKLTELRQQKIYIDKYNEEGLTMISHILQP